MIRGCSLLLVLLVFISAKAVEKDSLVRTRDLTFSSEFEKTWYGAHLKAKTDYLKLFLANSPDPDQHLKWLSEKIDFTIKEIEKSGVLTKKNPKKVKYIYDLVHSRFLNKYEEETNFYEIIKNGNYNCVTATALLAIVLDRLNIPYRIIELPTHVYLVAYPESDNIRLETTAPVFGFKTYSEEFKLQFVSNLKREKIIASNDATTPNELFNKYFFGSESVSLIGLVGIHYMNDAIYHQTKGEKTIAQQQMAKAYLLYPTERSQYMYLLTSVDRLNDKIDAITRAEIIGIVARSGSSLYGNDETLGEFARLTEIVLEKGNDRPLYAKCYHIVIANVKDPELANEFSYLFNYENGRLYYNQGNFVRAKPYFRKALEARPRSSEMAATFINCLAQSLRNERKNKVVLDTLLSYKALFPLMSEHPNFNSMIALAHVGYAGDCFDAGDVANAEKNFQEFERLVRMESVTIMSEDMVGNAYSAGAMYYFKKGQKAKAKAILDRGLEFVPNNYQLRSRRQMLN